MRYSSFLISLLLVILKPSCLSAGLYSQNGITYITSGNEAFVSSATNATGALTILSSITIEGKIYPVTSIGYQAFWRNYNITSVVIPNSITKIVQESFSNSSLSSIYIGSGVKEIGTDAFGMCSQLSTIIVDKENPIYDSRDGCNAIIHTSSNKLVAGCNNTTIPESVTSIGYRAFISCYRLKSIQIPRNIKSIGERAFASCQNLTNIIFAENTDDTLVIGEYAFAGCKNLASFTFPNNVVSVNDGLFYGCTSLSSIIIPSGVSIIGNRVFEDCSSLVSIELPEGLITLGNGVFSECTALESIHLPVGITTIPYGTFRSCSNLTSVYLNCKVTNIETFAFSGCNNLNSVICLNETPPTLQQNAFSSVANVILYVPHSCKEAYETADYWKDFKEILGMGPNSPIINFADSNVKAICVANWDTNGDGELDEDEAVAVIDIGELFNGNESITSFEELKYFTGLTSICDDAFCGCTNLSSINIPSNVTNIGSNAFAYGNNLVIVNIPNGLTHIKRNAFKGCRNLSSIRIPNSVTTIDDCAFEGTAWFENQPDGLVYAGLVAYKYKGTMPNNTDVKLKYGTKSIAERAFENCSSLSSVTCFNESPPIIQKNSFSNVANVILYVPQNSKGIYETADFWREFHVIHEMKQYSSRILFADLTVRDLCVANWDTNGDGELDENEAASVNTLGTIFKGNDIITSFDELKYFKGLTDIGNYSFSDCTSLTLVTIPSNVTSIGHGAFVRCTSLLEITIPNSVMSIGDNALSATAWFKNQPYGLVYAGKVAYAYKGTMPSNAVLSLQDGTLGIATGAFSYCGNLKSISIPNSVTNIGHWAFSFCTSLSSITIPNTVKSIGSAAFYGCSKLNVITFPESITKIGSDAFEETAWYNNKPNGMVYAGKVAYKYKGEMPSNTDIRLQDGTQGIAGQAFFERTNLKSIFIPNSVLNIGSSAFADCTSLNSITIPEGVTSIGDYAFSACSGLTSITIPSSVTSIGGDAFAGCNSLTSVNIDKETPISINETTFSNRLNATLYVPSGCKAAYENAMYWKEFKEIEEFKPKDIDFADAEVKRLCVANWDTNGDGNLSYDEAMEVKDIGKVFYDNDQIRSFNELLYFTGITSIPHEAFSRCVNMTSIQIPKNVAIIEGYAFNDCSRLSSIIFPNGLTEIQDDAFAGCTNIGSLDFPTSLRYIGERAFRNCSSLKSIYIPNSVQYILTTAFDGCSGLESIEVQEGTLNYDSRDNCNAIIETSSNALHTGCKTTVIPESVTAIRWYAYVNDQLRSVVIPKNVTSINRLAFLCPNLDLVVVKNPEPCKIYSDSFSNQKNATLIVPSGCKSAYEAADYWKEFKEIIEDTSEIIDFADSRVKQLCVAQWDTDGDGELSYNEAAAVTSIKNVFTNKPEIQTFDELENFTGLTSINLMAFSSCSNLTSIRIPENVTNIALSAFSGCTKLASVNIPENVTKLGSAVFNQCLSLTSIIIPKNVQSIGSEPFAGCSNLVSIVIDEGNTVYDSRGNCNAIIKTGSNELIVGCKNTVIPNSVTSIASGTFSGCTELASIIIPGSVTNISAKAFESCDALTSVTVNAVMPPTIAATTFSNAANATLFVPYDSKEDYTAAAYWQDFQKIRSLDTDLIIIGTTGYATYCSENPLDFNEVTGMKAYIASYFKPSAGNLLLTRVTETQASEGLCIVGEPGEHEVRWSETDMTYSNLLKGVTTATTLSPTEDGNTNFILANGAHGVGFYPLSNASTLAAGKAYLQLPTAMIYGVKAVGLSFDDVETDIEELTDQLTNAIMYNLQGQRVFNPGRGIYIVNGKKVCIK